MEIPLQVREFISRALAEDVGHGDITSDCIIPPSVKTRAVVLAKQEMIVAGMDFFREVFYQVDHSVQIASILGDSQSAKKSDIICRVRGLARSILKAERLALNILQRLSGIATLTSAFVELCRGFDVRIVDTRKTTPGMRFMEKYAVRVGGGFNHRFGLYDGILIKDNHIKASGGIGKAVKTARQAHHLLKIEVEVGNIDEVRQALKAGADVIMLDNMTAGVMKKAVEIIRSSAGRQLIEASGNVSFDNVREIAAAGVDLISIGALTHSAPAADISLKII